jgi:hypothetical protein
MADGIFPTKDSNFNTYFGTVVAYLSVATNIARLGVSATRLADLTVLLATWNTLYPQSQNENTVTKTIIDNKNETREDAEELLRLIYDDIPNSALIAADRNTLNLHERKPASERPAIETAPDVILNSSAGFRMIVENRVIADTTRPSKQKDSDGVEYKYWFTPPTAADPIVVVGPMLSTKAKFTLQLAEGDGGKLLNLQSRWKNNVDESKSGPWCEVVSARVIW